MPVALLFLLLGNAPEVIVCEVTPGYPVSADPPPTPPGNEFTVSQWGEAWLLSQYMSAAGFIHCGVILKENWGPD